MKIALCLIVKNEAKNIIDCIDSLKGFYDKAFITDTGSDDKTVDLLKDREDVELSHFEWVDDFAAARNFNLSQVTPDYDWVLWCDADDRIIDEDASVKFRELIESQPEEVKAINLPYIYSHNKQSIERGIPEFKYHRKRVFRFGCCVWKGFIHEYPATTGPEIKHNDIIFHHFRDGTGVMNTKRNLRIFRKKLNEMNGDIRARYTFYYAKELTYNNLWEEAEEQFLTYLPISNWVPEKARAMYALANIQSRKGLKDEARSWCFKCIRLEPHNSDAYALLSRLSYDEQDYVSAYLWAYHALNSDEEKVKFFDFIPNRTWVPLELMAWSKWKQNEPKEAIELAKQALEHVPNSDHIKATIIAWQNAKVKN